MIRGRLVTQSYQYTKTRYLGSQVQTRSISWLQIATPPLAFGGLLLGLWAYKCMMMVIFQNKIIYMPSVPPFSRSEKISDYVYPKSIAWREERIRSTDGTQLALAIGTNEVTNHPVHKDTKTTVVAYFQGNASSLPPRLPGLSKVLSDLQSQSRVQEQFVIVALSYRGFWTSKGKPSQPGIEKDAKAFMHWLHDFASSQSSNTQLIVWGQSIGAAVAASATASWLTSSTATSQQIPIGGLIMETPFTNMKQMLITMYPQKWLPYRYLWPFLRNNWDNTKALESIGHQPARRRPRVLLIQAGKDELIPHEHSNALRATCSQVGIKAQWLSVPGAYHTTAASLTSGRQGITKFVLDVTSQAYDGSAEANKKPSQIQS